MSRISNSQGRSRKSSLLAGAALAVCLHAGNAAAADSTITVNSGQSLSNVTVSPAAGDTVTVNNAGRIGSTSSVPSSLAIQGSGGGQVIINNTGLVGGRIDFSAMTGGVSFETIYVSGRATASGWHFGGDSRLSAGDDVLGSADGGGIYVHGGFWSGGPLGSPSLDFGAGDDVFNNGGAFIVGEGRAGGSGTLKNDPRPTETTLIGLETFNNSGVIILGRGTGSDLSTPTTDADLAPDDVLIMNSGTFNGEGGRIIFDVILSGGGAQANCLDRDADFRFPVADCVNLRGATTEGVTGLTIRSVFYDDRGTLLPGGVVLVDVNGGESAAGHFIVDPTSDKYSSAFGGVIDEGLFVYALVYDEDDQQHKLFGMPGGAGQFAPMAGAVQNLWRTSTGGWFDRQADLRESLGGEQADGSVWIRLTGDFAERDIARTETVLNSSFAFDDSYAQDSYAVTGGIDLIAAEREDRGYVAGLMLGYTHSDVEFQASPNTARLNGFTGGVYGSIVSGGFFVDGAVNAMGLVMHNNIPTLGLFPAGTLIDTNIQSIGAQVEGGWRLPLGGGLFVEPLAAASYQTATFDDVFIRSGDASRPGATLAFDDATSLRASLGARLGLTADLGPATVQYSLTGRAGNEFDGESGLMVHTAGPDLSLGDDVSGQFSELAAGAAIFGMDGVVSGFLNVGGRFAEDFQSVNASAGFRFRW